MRSRSFLVAMIALAAGLAPAVSHAGTLVSATWTQDIESAWLDPIPSIALTVTNDGATCTDTNPNRVPGAGFLTCPTAGLQATGTSTASFYSVSLTMPLFEFQGFTTGGSLNIGTQANLQGSQVITGGSASATADIAIGGSVRVGGGRHTRGSMWSQLGSLLWVPLNIGKPGQEYIYRSFGYWPSWWTYVTNYGWTPGTLSFTNQTWSGRSLPDVVAMGSFMLTGNGGGTVTLVSPTRLYRHDFNRTLIDHVSFATLKLTFVPEPSSVLLLAAGALALLRFDRRS